MVTINHVYALPFGKVSRCSTMAECADAFWVVGRSAESSATSPACRSPPQPRPPTPTAPPAPWFRKLSARPYIRVSTGPANNIFRLPLSRWSLPGTRGNSGRDNLRGPGMTVYDANLVRKFRIKERVTAEFRFEAHQCHEPSALGQPQRDGEYCHLRPDLLRPLIRARRRWRCG